MRYELYVRQIYVDGNAYTYQRYLIIAFLAIEYVGTKIMGLNMSGFTMAQMYNMSSYDRLLIELGERNYRAPPLQSGPLKLESVLLLLRMQSFMF